MTRPKPRDPDRITQAEAAELLRVGEKAIVRMQREGLLVRLDGYPTCSRSDVTAVAQDGWLTGGEAARLLGISRTRLVQLVRRDKVPYRTLSTGRRVYRRSHVEVVAHARAARRDGLAVALGLAND